jgi:hypothetical protein
LVRSVRLPDAWQIAAAGRGHVAVNPAGCGDGYRFAKRQGKPFFKTAKNPME